MLWALPWLLTVALGLALHLADREEVPEDPWATIPFIAAHDLVAEQVVDAIGPLDHLPPTTARAFEYTSHFSPIPVPGPEDWLSLHPERPQTVLDYIESRPNRPEAPRNVIYILPVGSLPAERGPTVEELAEYARRFFGRPVEVMPVRPLDELDVPTRTRGHARQLNAAAVLDQLQLELPRDAYCLIAVTLEDLYPRDDYNYVFGLARLHTRVGVFSFARYHPSFFGESFEVDRRVVVRRALKVMSHEIGHMFGLEHCTHLHCNMNGSNHLSEVDRAPMHLCPVCLRKLHVALGFDPAERYGELAEHYDALGLDASADWAQQRRAYLLRSTDPD
ncbi:MAG: hypothetical protein KC501_06305 [Myxococcales bacterium]|nr:hypothetical protein [Myxococcales bacterium]